MTGGSVPAQVWQAYMSVAHNNMDIPTIPGLKPHPTQVAERQRLAALRAQNPDAAGAGAAGGRTQKVSAATQSVLKKLASELRKAAAASGVRLTPSSPPTSPGNRPGVGQPGQNGRRAELGSGRRIEGR